MTLCSATSHFLIFEMNKRKEINKMNGNKIKNDFDNADDNDDGNLIS